MKYAGPAVTVDDLRSRLAGAAPSTVPAPGVTAASPEPPGAPAGPGADIAAGVTATPAQDAQASREGFLNSVLSVGEVGSLGLTKALGIADAEREAVPAITKVWGQASRALWTPKEMEKRALGVKSKPPVREVAADPEKAFADTQNYLRAQLDDPSFNMPLVTDDQGKPALSEDAPRRYLHEHYLNLSHKTDPGLDDAARESQVRDNVDRAIESAHHYAYGLPWVATGKGLVSNEVLERATSGWLRPLGLAAALALPSGEERTTGALKESAYDQLSGTWAALGYLGRLGSPASTIVGAAVQEHASPMSDATLEGIRRGEDVTQAIPALGDLLAPTTWSPNQKLAVGGAAAIGLMGLDLFLDPIGGALAGAGKAWKATRAAQLASALAEHGAAVAHAAEIGKVGLAEKGAVEIEEVAKALPKGTAANTILADLATGAGPIADELGMPKTRIPGGTTQGGPIPALHALAEDSAQAEAKAKKGPEAVAIYEQAHTDVAAALHAEEKAHAAHEASVAREALARDAYEQVVKAHAAGEQAPSVAKVTEKIDELNARAKVLADQVERGEGGLSHGEKLKGIRSADAETKRLAKKILRAQKTKVRAERFQVVREAQDATATALSEYKDAQRASRKLGKLREKMSVKVVRASAGDAANALRAEFRKRYGEWVVDRLGQWHEALEGGLTEPAKASSIPAREAAGAVARGNAIPLDATKFRAVLDERYGIASVDAFLAHAGPEAEHLKNVLGAGNSVLSMAEANTLDGAEEALRAFSEHRTTTKPREMLKLYLANIADLDSRPMSQTALFAPLWRAVRDLGREGALRAAGRAELGAMAGRVGQVSAEVADALRASSNRASAGELEILREIGADPVQTQARLTALTQRTWADFKRVVERQEALADAFEAAKAGKVDDATRAAVEAVRAPALDAFGKIFTHNVKHPTLPGDLRNMALKALRDSSSYEDFMLRLRNGTVARNLAPDTRNARVFTMGALYVRHAVDFEEVVNATMRSLGGGITLEQAAAAQRLLTGQLDKVGDADEAIRTLNKLGMPSNRTSFLLASKTTAQSRELMQVGNEAFLPHNLVKEMQATYNDITKELEIMPAMDPKSTWAKIQSTAYWKLWKTSVLYGIVLPRPRMWINTTLDFHTQTWAHQGFFDATRLTLGQTGSFLRSVPGLGRILDTAGAAEVAKFATGSPVLRPLFEALNDPLVNEVASGRDGFVRGFNGRVWSHAELRRQMTDLSVVESMHAHEILATGERIKRKLDELPGWSLIKGEPYNEAVQTLGERHRAAYWLDLVVGKGIDPKVAAKSLYEAHFDWQHGLAEGELFAALKTMMPWYRYLRLSLENTGKAILGPLTTGVRDSKFARILQQERVLATAPHLVLGPHDSTPEGEHQRLLGLLFPRGYISPDQGAFPLDADPSQIAFAKEHGGRTIDHMVNVTGPSTFVGALNQLMYVPASISMLASGINATAKGGYFADGLPADYVHRLADPWVSAFGPGFKEASERLVDLASDKSAFLSDRTVQAKDDALASTIQTLFPSSDWLVHDQKDKATGQTVRKMNAIGASLVGAIPFVSTQLPDIYGAVANPYLAPAPGFERDWAKGVWWATSRLTVFRSYAYGGANEQKGYRKRVDKVLKMDRSTGKKYDTGYNPDEE